MKAEDLMQMINAGVRPVIQINDDVVIIDGKKYENGSVEYGNFSPGQRARIVSMKKKDEDMWEVTVDMSEFFEHNCSLDLAVHYGKDPNRLYKWHELESYPKDHIASIYVDTNIVDFSLLDDSSHKLMECWKATGTDKSYVEWLEEKVLAQ